MPAPDEVAIDIADAARRLSVSTRTIRRMIAAGELAAFSIRSTRKRPTFRIWPSALDFPDKAEQNSRSVGFRVRTTPRLFFTNYLI